MRSKEVERAIEEFIEIRKMNYFIKPIGKKIDTLLNYISELEEEIIILENTKNTCPVINTSDLRCDLKKYMKPFYHIERKRDVDG